MSNSDNLSNILDNELSNIFENLMNNYRDPPYEFQNNNEPNVNEQHLLEIHRIQLNMINSLINQYFSQINIFQENTRELLQMLRSTIHQQNMLYSHILRRNNTYTQPMPSYNRTPPRTTRNTNRAWNTEYTNISYEIPQIYIPQRPSATRLTQDQINNVIENVEYNEEMGEERCPITLENFIVGENICKIRNCGHIFKSAGLMQWFQRNVRCPVCRCDLRTTRRNSMSQPTEQEPSYMQDISGNLVNVRNSLYSRINNIISQLQNDLPNNDVPTVYTFDIPIYIDDASYNPTRNIV